MDRLNLLQKLTENSIFNRLFEGLVMLGVSGPFMLLYAGIVPLLWSGNYNFVQDSISSLTWTGMGWVQNFGFIITGFCMEVFAAVLTLSMPRARGFSLGVVFLALSGFFLILVGAFPADIPYLPRTSIGMVHKAAADTLFVLLPLGILLLAPSLKKDPQRRLLFKYSIASAVIALFWIGIYPLCLPKELGWFGLYERILALIEISWVEVMAISLLTLSRRLHFNTPLVSNITVASE